MVTIHLGRRLPDGSCGLPGGQRAGRPPPVRPCSRWGLQSHPGHPGRWCALTAPFHPCLCAGPGAGAIGGLLSVALSCGSPRLGVTQHRALWSPDVPRTGPVSRPGRGHPAGSLPARQPTTRPALRRSRVRRNATRCNPPSMPSAGAMTRCPKSCPGAGRGAVPAEQPLVLVAHEPDDDPHRESRARTRRGRRGCRW